MQAIKIKTPATLNHLQLCQLADPGQPAAGQIRVRIHASSLNYHDYAVVCGYIPTADGRIPMSDGAGVVEAVGEGVDEFKIGDHVVSWFFPGWLNGKPKVGDFSTVPGDGVDGYARETVITAAHNFTHSPKNYSHAQAATLTTAGLTAWRALVVEAQVKPGDTVLTMGTGGVSIFALQMAKTMGANVIATSSSDAKLEKLTALGADQVINYRTCPEWGQKVLELTNNRGVDTIVEVGGPGTLAQSFTAIRVGGVISLIGILTGMGGDIPTAALMGKQARLQGLVVGNREQQIEMIRAIETTNLKPIIDRSFKLEEIADAFRYQESGKHFGKICLEF